MSSGRDFGHCYHRKSPRPADRLSIIAPSSMGYYGSTARVLLGETYPSATGGGRR
jgi:hypothetical protein